MFISVAVLSYFIGVKIKKIRKNTGYIWCTFIFLFITLQPSVILAFISTASCRNIAGVNYIKANVSLECYTASHNFYLSTLIVPSLLGWAIFIPSLFFMKLYRSRDKVSSFDHFICLKFKYIF